MKSKLSWRPSAASFLVLTNVVFWLAFAAVFAEKSYAYIPHEPTFEERAPDLIYFGRAMSYLENEQLIPFVRVELFVQWPSFRGAEPFIWYMKHRGLTATHVYLGISMGGYHLLLVCLLSFLQWYLIGFLIDWARHRLAAKATLPNQSA